MASVTAKDIPEEQGMFTAIWNVYKKYYIPEDSDDYWANLTMDIQKIHNEYNTKLCENLCLAIAEELEGKFKGRGIQVVHLIENYYADPNNMGFTLLEERGTKDKDGNPQYNTLGYCGSFEEALFLLKRKVVDRKLKNGYIELSEALDIIQKTTDEINKAMKGVWL